MALNQLQTGPVYSSVGNAVNQRGGNFGETIVSQYGGKYAQLAKDGLLFNYTVKTGAAILLSATTGNVPTIWNPAGSGTVVYICKLLLNFLSGTTTISSLQWMVTKNAGNAIATGGAVVTFTDQTPEPAIAGGPFISKVRFAPAVCTFTVAPAFYASSGVNLGAVSPSAGSGNYDQDYDGAIAIYPGTALSLCSSVTTTTSLWFSTIIGAELSL
jgi:hypothetical protein